MATVTETRMFPPIIAPYIPAKNIESVNNGIDIPFDLNELNDPTVITEVHVMITRQLNYKTLFKVNLYPLGIYPLTFTQTMIDTGIIHIPETVLNVGQLNFNEYYKIQLRFSAVDITDPDARAADKTGSPLSDNLLNEANMAQFSEWSSVGLLRFVAEPTFVLHGNIQDDSNEMLPDNVNPYYLTSHFLDISGRYTKTGATAVILDTKTFNKADDNEYLASWQIQIKNSNEEVLMDSGVQQVNFRGSNINEIKYNAPFYFQLNVNYIITITLTTANLYEVSYNYLVATNQEDNNWGSQNDIYEHFSLDSVIGKINVTFEPVNQETGVPAGGKLFIRRADRNDNFTRWDTIWSYTIKEPIVKDHPVVFDDFTIESGTIYKYTITYINGEDESYTAEEGPALSVFDHSFLTGEGTQLCVKFNPNISSFKYNVSDNTINTIGGQYPYITRNGNMKYRTFALSGTIAYEMDERNQFTSRSDIYGEWINTYGTYFVNRYINQQNDRITQREFREMVMNYFYDDQPKLFRSTPEGNILVRITDVNLTPNQQLARMIYDFNCTVTEIGDCTIDNYKLYKIQDFGEE